MVNYVCIILSSSVNDALLEKLQKLDLQLQEAQDNFIESSNCAISDTEEASLYCNFHLINNYQIQIGQ